ncbi:MAG: DUF885 domain-containing protein [Saprospiraceae bacterium]|nr:DUF885 domain-containing protein [Saprospiraceae bacterium]
MKKFIFYALLVLVAACQNANNKETTVTKTADVAKIFEDYYKERMRLSPFESTANGETAYNDQFPIDISDSYRDTLKQFYTKFKTTLAAVDASKLTETERTSFDILSWDIDRALESFAFPDHLMPINQFWGKTLDLGQLGSGNGSQPFKSINDYDNWLRRISHFPAWADTAISNMRRGIAQGWVLPKALVVKILPQLKPMAETATTSHLFYQPIAKLKDNGNIPNEEKVRLTVEYTKMVNEVVKPSYKKLYDFMQKEYLPKARTSSGISAVPKGADYYKYWVKYWTTTDMTPDEIFDLGQREVTRIRAEMEAVKAQVGFKGDLKAFFKHVTEGEAKLRPFTNAKQVIDNFNAIHNKMKPSLEKQFELVPKTAFEVRRTEAFREASASAEYVQGNPEQNRAGVFYTPIPDVKKYNVFQDEALFLHEAIPGHHYQVMLQAENAALPKFRRYLWYGAYGEGWALYTEGLGKELGLYSDPYQYFGRLGNEMHRAIRLVVDVGLHAKGWTREQAIKYDLDNEADSEDNIIAEVERYMAIPGQALSYKVGEQKILQLKKQAMDALGAKFDIRKFHNEVLNDGCVPLAILEKKVARYIQGAK